MTGIGTPWVAGAAAGVFAAVGGVHGWHLLAPGGGRRLWHAVHVLMAAGMTRMLLPAGVLDVPFGYGAATFALVGVVIAVLLVRERSYRRPVGVLWLAAVADLAVMTYMFTMMSRRVVLLTVVLTGWLVLQALFWAGGHRRPGVAARLSSGAGLDTGVRVSLCAMSVGMAGMLIAMHWAMPHPAAPTQSSDAPSTHHGI